MQLRWTAPAARDLYHIFEYIRADNAAAAVRVRKTIQASCRGLLKMPQLGRPGESPDTRELPLASLPYLVIYRVGDTQVEILRVWHGAQNR